MQGWRKVAEIRAGGNGSRTDAEEKPSSRSLIRPELDPTERAISAAIFAVTLAYLWLFRRYTFLEPDEGIILQGAQRILRGEVLYRDFFSYFTPGSYYFLALLFKGFGSSFLVGRTALVFFGGIYSVISYLLARRVCSRGTALWVAAVVALITTPYRFEVLHNWDSTLWFEGGGAHPRLGSRLCLHYPARPPTVAMERYARLRGGRWNGLALCGDVGLFRGPT